MSNSVDLSKDLGAVVVNYQTPDLLDRAVRTFHEAYPDVAVLIVDNGSEDSSHAAIDLLEDDYPATIRSLRLPTNLYHGPAMNRALHQLEKPYAYLFDSDTITRQTGFLEAMVKLLSSRPEVYGIGRVLHVNSRGFSTEEGTPILWAPYMLIDRVRYTELPPFQHHGVPVLENMLEAHRRGLELEDFPIRDYVDHLGRGTADRYGYGLGLRSKLNRLLHRLGLDEVLDRMGL